MLQLFNSSSSNIKRIPPWMMIRSCCNYSFDVVQTSQRRMIQQQQCQHSISSIRRYNSTSTNNNHNETKNNTYTNFNHKLLTIERNKTSVPIQSNEHLIFGKQFTPHMIQIKYEQSRIYRVIFLFSNPNRIFMFLIV